MQSPVLTRRLAAILIADVAGYSRLMERDDTGTFARLRSVRDEVVDPAILSHDGRIVKTAGDGFLAEFPSALAALRAAVQIQREMARRNADVTAEDRIDYRIGLNLGDIMIDGSDIAGDGVNVASRLESLAEPGGICVSGSVREQVHGQMDVAFVDAGEQHVKNIERPIRIYRISLQPKIVLVRQRPRRFTPATRLSIVGAVFATIVVASAALLYRSDLLSPKRPVPEPPAMSLAVGPFAAADSGAQFAQYAAALRQDVVTGIGSVERRITLRRDDADRGSSGGSGAAQVIGRGARYTLKGEIRRAGGGYLVNVSLIDALSSTQAWSGTFALPDADASNRSPVAIRKLIAAVADAVEAAETRRVVGLPIERLDATELVLRGWAAFDVAPTLANAHAAERLFDAALRLDPHHVRALRERATIVDFENDVDPNPDHQRIVREFDDFSARALKLDSGDPVIWAYRSIALAYLGRWNAALEAIDQAIRLDPFNPRRYVNKAWLMNMTGRPADALALIAKAMVMEPSNPEFPLRMACEAHLLLGEARDAIEACEKASGLDPGDWIVHLFLVAAYENAAETTKAAAARAAVDRIVPGYTIAQLRAKGYSDHPAYLELAEQYWYAGLRKAGIPEA
ncbi:MAG TPA: adenylate/guanylate cyclase domain-containing protein [Casimicrobiaceae bacterium]|jgi:class 3 adenylate cyclase/tetratricopeptide (TPR) repeat protein|nr:adenylate/guanylate cyclase domain-containing protein [Casimicrobiaceae bacterium]